jgi:hypothetical protein
VVEIVRAAPTGLAGPHAVGPLRAPLMTAAHILAERQALALSRGRPAAPAHVQVVQEVQVVDVAV